MLTDSEGQEIQNVYQRCLIFLFQDLVKDLHGELSGNFRETIMALFEPTTYYDAWSLNKAMMVCIAFEEKSHFRIVT